MIFVNKTNDQTNDQVYHLLVTQLLTCKFSVRWAQLAHVNCRNSEVLVYGYVRYLFFKSRITDKLFPQKQNSELENSEFSKRLGVHLKFFKSDMVNFLV